jgi:hypothetical protein
MSEQTNYETPYYAHFEHPDGSLYLLWVTHSRPKTERGHQWHVHASFDKHGTLQPVIGAEGWNMGPYSMHNWDFDSEDQALKEFGERLRARFDHGYQIVRAQLPEKYVGS